MYDLMEVLARVGVIVCIVGTPLLLIIWGSSVLYRGLDGDRFLIRGRVKGRWINPVNRRLIALGAVSIALGWIGASALTLKFAPDTTAKWVVWAAAVAGTLALTPATLAWAWAGRRAGGRPRCPKCLYSVAGLAGMTCPECGFVATSELMWLKPRRRWLAFGMVPVLPLLAAALIFFATADNITWRSAIPSRLIISRLDTMPDTVLGLEAGLGDPRAFANLPAPGSLVDRLDNGTLSLADHDALATRLDDLASSARDPDTFMRALTIASVAGHPITIDPGDAGFADWVRLALEPACTGKNYLVSWNWHREATIFVPSSLSHAERKDMIERLLAAVASSPATRNFNVPRVATARALAADDLTLLALMVDAVGADYLARVMDVEGSRTRLHIPIDPRVLVADTPALAGALAWSRWSEAATAAERSAWSWVVCSMVLGADPEDGVAFEFDSTGNARRASPQREQDIIELLVSEIASHPNLLADPYAEASKDIRGLRLLLALLLERSANAPHLAPDPAFLDRSVVLATIQMPRGDWLYDFDTLLTLAADEHQPLRAAAAWSLLQILEWGLHAQLIERAERVLALPEYAELESLKASVRESLAPDDADTPGEPSPEPKEADEP